MLMGKRKEKNRTRFKKKDDKFRKEEGKGNQQEKDQQRGMDPQFAYIT